MPETCLFYVEHACIELDFDAGAAAIRISPLKAQVLPTAHNALCCTFGCGMLFVPRKCNLGNVLFVGGICITCLRFLPLAWLHMITLGTVICWDMFRTGQQFASKLIVAEAETKTY